jgi:hypothetical protein
MLCIGMRATVSRQGWVALRRGLGRAGADQPLPTCGPDLLRCGESFELKIVDEGGIYSATSTLVLPKTLDVVPLVYTRDQLHVHVKFSNQSARRLYRAARAALHASRAHSSS